MLCILIVAWYSLQVTFQLPFPIPHTFGHDYLAWVRMTSRPYPMSCLGWHPGFSFYSGSHCAKDKCHHHCILPEQQWDPSPLQASMWGAHNSSFQGFSDAQQEHILKLQKMLVDGSGAIKGLRNRYTDFYELHLTTKASTKLCGAPHNSHSLSGSMVQLSSSLEARISSRGRQALGEAALFCPGLLPAACGELAQLWGQRASILAQNLQLMNRTWFALGKSLFLSTGGSVIFGSYPKTWKSGGMNSNNLYQHVASGGAGTGYNQV